MSAISVEFEDVLLGNPDQLDPRAADLVTAAAAIEQAAQSLRGLIDGQISQSTDALARTATEVARSLNKARTRYRNTGEALQTYAADLRPIQKDARAAIATAEYYDQRSATLPNDISRREGDLLRAEAVDAPQHQIDEIENDLRRLRQSESNAYAQLQDARQQLSSARDRLRAIADAAIAKIETAIEGDSDSAYDNWNQFWEGAAKWIGDWAANVLKGVLEFLGQLLAVLVAIVVILVAIVIVVALLAAIAAVIGWIALAVLAVLIVGSLLLLFTLRDGSSSRQPRHVDDASKTFDRSPAAPDAHGEAPADYGDLFEDVGRQDVRGGQDSTHIRVVAIMQDGKVVAWRVQLPSTQNWSPFNEHGGLNDLSTDAMLALNPSVRTQYERAVYDAMRRAGVFDSDAPIMLTGWSLGGMMAGDIATDPALDGRVQSVVTAGSAIDKYADAIDPSVRVTQVNNVWDPVHHLELVGSGRDDVPGPNWQTFHPVDPRIHDSTMYGELADDVVPDVRPGDEIFFAGNAVGTTEHVHEEVYVRG